MTTWCLEIRREPYSHLSARTQWSGEDLDPASPFQTLVFLRKREQQKQVWFPDVTAGAGKPGQTWDWTCPRYHPGDTQKQVGGVLGGAAKGGVLHC